MLDEAKTLAPVKENKLPLVSSEGAFTPKQVSEQVRMVMEVMRQNMRQGEHYGVIPGTGKWNPQTRQEEGKMNLLKSGAEKLCLLFRLVPDYDIEIVDLQDGHREARIKCKLTQVSTGRYYGAGVGSASTLESKYRYRSDVVNDAEGKPMEVPHKYWQTRDASLLGAEGNRPLKKDGKWMVVRRVENPDIADTWNTILKMAKKRAYVDATISATAASDIFTQDMDETTERVDTTSTVTVEGKVTWVQRAAEGQYSGYTWVRVVPASGGGAVAVLYTKETDLGDELLELENKTASFQVKPGKKYGRILNWQPYEAEEPEMEESSEE